MSRPSNPKAYLFYSCVAILTLMVYLGHGNVIRVTLLVSSKMRFWLTIGVELLNVREQVLFTSIGACDPRVLISAGISLANKVLYFCREVRSNAAYKTSVYVHSIDTILTSVPVVSIMRFETCMSGSPSTSY